MSVMVMTAGPVANGAGRDLSSRVFMIVVAAVAATFLLAAAPRISQEPGDSHDGRNVGLWSVAARSMLEQGPIESRLGSLSPERGVYAHHPPGVTFETAVFLATTGEGPWSRKAPAYLSSIAAVVVGAILLRRLGLSRIAAVAGLTVMATTPMFLVFGASSNMEAVSLPWMFLLLAAWADREHPLAPTMAAAGAVGCVWIFHGSLLLTFVLGVISLQRIRRGVAGPVERATARWGLISAILLALYFAWANHGLGELLDQGGHRSSLNGMSVSGWLTRQGDNLGAVFSWPVLALAAAGLIFGIGHGRPDRRLAAILAAVVPLLYLAVTVDGAYHHEYWNYPMLVSVAVGIALLIELARVHLSTVGRGVVAGAVVVLALAGLTVRVPAHSLFADGSQAAELLARTELPPDQQTALTYPLVVQPLSWVSWYTRLPAANLTGPGLIEWAHDRPDDLVLVESDGVNAIDGPDAWTAIVNAASGRSQGDYAILRASTLADITTEYGPIDQARIAS